MWGWDLRKSSKYLSANPHVDRPWIDVHAQCTTNPIHSAHGIWIKVLFFLRKFQPMTSDQDTNQFLCMRGLNPKSLIQPSETLLIKLTGTHIHYSNLLTLTKKKSQTIAKYILVFSIFFFLKLMAFISYIYTK